MSLIQIPGMLEIDQERGVIYFHSSNSGMTKLRICRLPAPIPDPRPVEEMLDVTHMHGCSWQPSKSFRFLLGDDTFVVSGPDPMSAAKKQFGTSTVKQCLPEIFYDEGNGEWLPLSAYKEETP